MKFADLGRGRLHRRVTHGDLAVASEGDTAVMPHRDDGRRVELVWIVIHEYFLPQNVSKWQDGKYGRLGGRAIGRWLQARGWACW